jgi:competence protein ComK
VESVNKVEHYIINQETVLLTGEYDSNGKLCTRVLEGESDFFVDQSPIQVITATMNYYGHNFKGAIEGAQSILGKTPMCPIMVCVEQDICLFPHRSPVHADCIWFNYKHVVKTHADGCYTNIELSNGHIIKVKARHASFNHKKQKAGDLRRILFERSQAIKMLYDKPKKEYTRCIKTGKLQIK